MPTALPDTVELLKSFGTALGLGLLVGLQREWVQNRIAGIRTFALLTLFGAMAGLLGLMHGDWVIAAAMIAFAGVVVVGTLGEAKSKELDSGLTTEMAMLVMFTAGMITILGQRLIAVIIAGVVMVLLQSKKPLHDMVRRIGEDDLREIARLVLAGLVILPALPNRE
ncbi:MAG: MgtC/SapB family protein, partial [Prosthecobacter sp.]